MNRIGYFFFFAGFRHALWALRRYFLSISCQILPQIPLLSGDPLICTWRRLTKSEALLSLRPMSPPWGFTTVREKVFVSRQTYPPSHFHILVCFWTGPWLIWAIPDCRGWWCSLFPLAGWLWRRCKTAFPTRRQWGTKEKMVSVASCPPLAYPSPWC